MFYPSLFHILFDKFQSCVVTTLVWRSTHLKGNFTNCRLKDLVISLVIEHAVLIYIVLIMKHYIIYHIYFYNINLSIYNIQSIMQVKSVYIDSLSVRLYGPWMSFYLNKNYQNRDMVQNDYWSDNTRKQSILFSTALSHNNKS